VNKKLNSLHFYTLYGICFQRNVPDDRIRKTGFGLNNTYVIKEDVDSMEQLAFALHLVAHQVKDLQEVKLAYFLYTGIIKYKPSEQ
jgi:hypothetical protein